MILIEIVVEGGAILSPDFERQNICRLVSEGLRFVNKKRGNYEFLFDLRLCKGAILDQKGNSPKHTNINVCPKAYSSEVCACN